MKWKKILSIFSSPNKILTNFFSFQQSKKKYVFYFACDYSEAIIIRAIPFK